MPKYLDLTGLTTLKSKLDTTYAKKNDVYTKAQVDSAIAGVGIPTITIALSQVISQDPVQFQLTQAQCDVLDANQQVNFDASAFGYLTVIMFKSFASNDVMEFTIVAGADSTPDHIDAFHVAIDKTTLIATYYNYEIKSYGVDGTTIQEDSSLNYDRLYLTGNLPYLTTAPSSNNASGYLKIVVLNSEPATRYDGYFYIITGE